MLQIRRSDERGVGYHGWLDSRHTFSFAEYFDPEHMGFRALRVINEDRIEGGTGFGAHPHRDMEIISYVVKGALEHKDSMGNVGVIKPGEVQRMSAGTGVTHSEYNKLENEEAHFFQIWILPSRKGGSPSYGQKSFEPDLLKKKLVLAVSGDGRDGSIPISQDADLYISRTEASDELSYEIKPNRYVWIQVVKGELEVNGEKIAAGDGLAVSEERLLKLRSLKDSEILLFDLA